MITSVRPGTRLLRKRWHLNYSLDESRPGNRCVRLHRGSRAKETLRCRPGSRPRPKPSSVPSPLARNIRDRLSVVNSAAGALATALVRGTTGNRRMLDGSVVSASIDSVPAMPPSLTVFWLGGPRVIFSATPRRTTLVSGRCLLTAHSHRPLPRSSPARNARSAA